MYDNGWVSLALERPQFDPNFHSMVNYKNYFRRKLALAKSLIRYLSETLVPHVFLFKKIFVIPIPVMMLAKDRVIYDVTFMIHKANTLSPSLSLSLSLPLSFSFPLSVSLCLSLCLCLSLSLSVSLCLSRISHSHQNWKSKWRSKLRSS